MRFFLRSKIHKAHVTEADVGYVGSVTIDEDLMDLAGLEEGERVLITSNTTGERLETYAIPGPRGSGIIGMNGAAAQRVGTGEEIIIMGFELSKDRITPKVILVDRDNRFVEFLTEGHSTVV